MYIICEFKLYINIIVHLVLLMFSGLVFASSFEKMWIWWRLLLVFCWSCFTMALSETRNLIGWYEIAKEDTWKWLVGGDLGYLNSTNDIVLFIYVCMQCFTLFTVYCSSYHCVFLNTFMYVVMLRNYVAIYWALFSLYLKSPEIKMLTWCVLFSLLRQSNLYY